VHSVTMPRETEEVGVFQIGSYLLRPLRWFIAEYADVNAVAAAVDAADLVLLTDRIEIGAGDNVLPNFALDLQEKIFRRGVGD
jgi:hypothetical protein